MKSFVIDSFKGGISDYEDKGIPGSFKNGSGLDVRKLADTLSCGYAIADYLASGTMTGLPLWIIPASNGKTYYFCKGGKIFEDNAGTFTLKYTDADGDILGAEEMPCSNGKTYLFWATATKLHCKEIPGNADWSVDTDANVVVGATTYTYPKTNLISAPWHTMKLAVGNLQICNKNTMALVGYDGSYTNNSLQLIPGNSAKCIIERNRYVIIGCDRTDAKEEAGVFIWDTESDNWNDKQIYPIKTINAMIDTEIPLLQIGASGQLFYGDGVNKQPILTFPGGGSVNPGGVANDNGMAIFGVFGNGAGKSGIYSYGRKRKNASIVLNLEYPFDCDEIGAVAKVGSLIVFSWKKTTAGVTTYGVKKVNTAAMNNGVYESLDLKMPPKLQNIPTWNMVVLSMAALPTGCKVEVKRRIDKSGSFIAANIEGGSTEFTTVGGTEAVFLIGDKGKICEIQILLTSSGAYTPEVYKAEVIFD